LVEHVTMTKHTICSYNCTAGGGLCPRG